MHLADIFLLGEAVNVVISATRSCFILFLFHSYFCSYSCTRDMCCKTEHSIQESREKRRFECAFTTINAEFSCSP